LDIAETDTFARVLSGFVADTAIGVLLVEHDMALVSKVCSYTYMLDFGRLICSGPTADVLVSPEVQAAYLGSETLDSDGTVGSTEPETQTAQRTVKLRTAELEVARDV
jgi:ABC-type methionine transport system ATPase subunit